MAPRELRQMSKGFYGAGCPHPGVECFMQQIQKLQAHSGCDSNLGLKMSVSIKMLIVELGVLVASGKSFDKKFMTKRKPEENWSTLRFPK